MKHSKLAAKTEEVITDPAKINVKLKARRARVWDASLVVLKLWELWGPVGAGGGQEGACASGRIPAPLAC